MDLNTPTYEKTRRAWREIWTGTAFGRELATLDYPRARQLLDLYMPWLPKDARTPILEAGCGPGHVVYYLRQQGFAALGLDYAPEALSPTRILHPDLPLHAGDVHQLPYPAEAFGAYLSFGVVEHFEQGPAQALAEAARVLRPGGILVLSTPTPNFVEALLRLRSRLVPGRMARQAARAEYFETQYTPRALAGFVRDAGFDVLRATPYSHSFTFYGLHRVFRGTGYYAASRLGELAGMLGRRLAPWWTAFECLIIARKPSRS